MGRSVQTVIIKKNTNQTNTSSIHQILYSTDSSFHMTSRAHVLSTMIVQYNFCRTSCFQVLRTNLTSSEGSHAQPFLVHLHLLQTRLQGIFLHQLWHRQDERLVIGNGSILPETYYPVLPRTYAWSMAKLQMHQTLEYPHPLIPTNKCLSTLSARPFNNPKYGKLASFKSLASASSDCMMSVNTRRPPGFSRRAASLRARSRPAPA